MSRQNFSLGDIAWVGAFASVLGALSYSVIWMSGVPLGPRSKLVVTSVVVLCAVAMSGEKQAGRLFTAVPLVFLFGVLVGWRFIGNWRIALYLLTVALVGTIAWNVIGRFRSFVNPNREGPSRWENPRQLTMGIAASSVAVLGIVAWLLAASATHSDHIRIEQWVVTPPAKNLLSGAVDLGPDRPSIRAATSLSPGEAEVFLRGCLINGAGAVDGERVAIVALGNGDESIATLEIRAGDDLGEWALNDPSVRRESRHRRPQAIGESWPVIHPTGETFIAHRYDVRRSVRLDRSASWISVTRVGSNSADRSVVSIAVLGVTQGQTGG